MVESFDSDGIGTVAFVGPRQRVVATNRPELAPAIESDPGLEAAFRTGEVQAGWTEDAQAFRVHVPVDRIPGPRWRQRLEDHPVPLVPPVGHDEPPPWPPPGWGLDPGRVVLVLDVEPSRAAWLSRWATVHAAVSMGAITLLWVAWFGARRSARAIAALEAERRRRETLARLGEMSAVLAHEVRNPLASLKGQLQLAVEEARLARPPSAGAGAQGGEKVLEQLMARVVVALEEAARIEALIRGLLDYARDEQPRIEPIPAQALLDLARDLAGPWPQDVNLEVVSPPGLRLDADRNAMARALANLMRNAAEAADSGGRVRVVAVARPGQNRVTVEDSGPGVPQDLGERAFEPFVTGKVRGVGLGLAVARKVVEAHGGRVEVGRSEDLGGARFELVWPARGS